MTSTTLSSCLKCFYMIAGTGATTVTTAARNLFAEANFATRSSAGSYIGYNTTNNQITFSHTGTRYIEVLFVGAGGANTTGQSTTVSFVLSGVTQKSISVYSTGTVGVPKEICMTDIYAVTSSSTFQINYSGGTNSYVGGGSVVIVTFIN